MKILKNNFLVKFTVTLFLVGFIFGLLYFITLKPEISSFIGSFKDLTTTSRQNTFLLHLSVICLVFFMSISVVGFPLVLILNFYTGLSIGYTLCAFISSSGFGGFCFYIIFFILSKLVFSLMLLYFFYVSSKFTYNLVIKLIKKDRSCFYELIIGHFYRFLVVLGVTLVNSLIIYLISNKILSLMINWL